jgi:hypothetical protein
MARGAVNTAAILEQTLKIQGRTAKQLSSARIALEAAMERRTALDTHIQTLRDVVSTLSDADAQNAKAVTGLGGTPVTIPDPEPKPESELEPEPESEPSPA